MSMPTSLRFAKTRETHITNCAVPIEVHAISDEEAFGRVRALCCMQTAMTWRNMANASSTWVSRFANLVPMQLRQYNRGAAEQRSVKRSAVLSAMQRANWPWSSKTGCATIVRARECQGNLERPSGLRTCHAKYPHKSRKR